MRWLLVKLLSVAKGINAIVYIALMIGLYVDGAELRAFAVGTGFMILAALFIEGCQESLRRQLLKRPQNVKMPKPPPVIMPAPEPVPQAPQKPAERRLAPPPMVEVGEAIPAASVSSLPANLRQFVEQGEKIIQADHGRS